MINVDVLNKITETAVRAACIRDYDIGPLKKRYIDPEGGYLDIDIEPPPHHNRLCDLESCVDLYKRHRADGAEIFVGRDIFNISSKSGCGVAHDGTRTKGQSVCLFQQSEAIVKIYECQDKNLSPETFEKLAKLYFGADAQFVNRIRKLQWKPAGIVSASE